MDEALIRLLHEIGVPVAIIASAAVTAFMRSIHDKIALASAVITLIAVGAYVPIELVPKARDAFAETTLGIEPSQFIGFKKNGAPVSISVSAKRGNEVIKQVIIEEPREDDLKENKLTLLRHEAEAAGSFYVLRSGLKIGQLTDQELKSVGLYRSNGVVKETNDSFIDESAKVYLGNEWDIGETNTAVGNIKLKFLNLRDGKAEITVISNRLSAPNPRSVLIKNKGLQTLSFEGKYEITILVREADFLTQGEEWAAFTIIKS